MYHKKILIIDQKELYIGSANCTNASLSIHGNQIIGFSDTKLIEKLLNNNSYISDKYSYFILPKDRVNSLNLLLEKLSSARVRIYIAMYSFTHPKIIEGIIGAHKRGVKIILMLDHSTTKGRYQKKIKSLQKKGIDVYIRSKPGLLHHKCALIDNTYIFGSTNWSNAGFNKNEETLIFIDDIPDEFNQKISSFFRKCLYYSKILQ